MSDSDGMTYRDAGVDTSEAARALARLGEWIRRSLSLRDAEAQGRPLRGLGYYANVIELGGGLGLALSSDGVGTKLIVAEIVGRYDTVGIDCVAMNVNDLICVGAEPLALLDYVAVGHADPEVFEQLGRGLYEAARRCRITIPGGEVAQVGEMLRGEGVTHGLDLVGTAVGIVPVDRMLFGQHLVPGDLIVGVGSTGLHSNGYTLARKVLAPRREDYFRHDADLGRTIGEELLEPTALYVELFLDLVRAGIPLHAVCHITGDGFMNLSRVEAPVGFVLDALPESPAVFQVIEARGRISKREMYSVFNMGVGLCVMVPPGSESQVIAAARDQGFPAQVIGSVTAEEGRVTLPQHGLESRDGSLTQSRG